MKKKRLVGWTDEDEKLLMSLREAKVPFEKIRKVLSQTRSIEALQSRVWKLANPDLYVQKLAKQEIYNQSRYDRIRNGNAYGYHAQEWPEDTWFGPNRAVRASSLV